MGMSLDGELFYGYPFIPDEVSDVTERYGEEPEVAFEEIKVPRGNYDYDYIDNPDIDFGRSWEVRVTNKEEQQRYFADKKALRESIKPVRWGYSGLLEYSEATNIYLYTSNYVSFSGIASISPSQVSEIDTFSVHSITIKDIVETLGLKYDPSRVGWYLTASYG